MDTDLDTLATALYVAVDDLVAAYPELAPWRPAVGIAPRVSDAELVTLAVLGTLHGSTNETAWVRYTHAHLSGLFPYVPQQSGYNKRLRKLAGLLDAVTRQLAGATSVFTDDVLVVDSTPVECARSRATVARSALAGWAEYGYCASHSRFFWGLRLHLVATLHGLPIAYALTGAEADERQVLLGLIDTDPAVSLVAGRTIIADKNYYGRQFEHQVAATGFTLLRKPRAGEGPRAGGRLFKPLRQTIESVFSTLKDPLSLERHRARTPRGVITRVLTRLLALTAVIWHNDRAGAPTRRSLLAYDH